MTKHMWLSGIKTSATILALAACLLVSNQDAIAQIGTTAALVGMVRDVSGGILPGATVTATHVATGSAQTAITDGAGRYRISLLPLGEYRIEVSLQGFQSERRVGIVLAVGRTQEVSFTLQIGEMAENVTVTGGAPLVDTSSSTVSTVVSGETIRTLPLSGRSFDQLITLSPGTVMFDQRRTNAFSGTANSYSASGIRTGATQLTVDGSEYAGGGGTNSSVNTASGKLLGVEAIQEFAVITNAADASYGKKGGAQVTIVTRSGANEYHGSAFEFLRNDVFDARNFFDAERPELQRHNYGFALGGRIVQNKSFFFGNFEQLRERRGITDVHSVPTAAARQGVFPDGRVIPVNPAAQPILDMFPLPNGRDFGDGTAELQLTTTRKIDDTFAVGRVDHQLSGSDSLFARYLIQTGVLLDPSGGLGQFADRPELRTQLLTVGHKKTISARLLNQITVAFNRGRMYLDIVPINGFESPAELFLVPGATGPGAIRVGIGTGGGSAANPFPNLGGSISVGAQERLVVRSVFEASNQVSYTTGPHYLQLGGQIQRIHSDESQQPQKRGQLQFPLLEALLMGRPSRLDGPFPGSDAERGWRQTYVAAYIQDNYRVRPTFTVNLGLRWEFLSNPTEIEGRIGRWVPEGSRLDGLYPNAPSVVDHVFAENKSGNFAPRIGFAWDVFGTGRTSLRSGMGLFYSQIENEYRRELGAAAPFTQTARVDNPPFPNPGQALETIAPGLVAPLGVHEAPDTPRTIQANLRLEQEVTPNTMVAAAYVGSRIRNFVRYTNPQIPPPFVNQDGRLEVPQQVRTPGVAANTTFLVWDAKGSYDSLQLEVDRRLSRGLQLKAAFTWAKAIDEGADNRQGLTGIAGVALVATDPRFDRGPSPFDVRRRFVLSWNYELPFGTHDGTMGTLLNEWQLAGVFSAQGGFPFTVFAGVDSFRGRGGGDRADLAPGRTRESIILGGPDRYFDSTAFDLPPSAVLGNTPSGFLTGPGLALMDMSLIKMFRISRGAGLQFRLEVFNVLNRANFALPDNTVFDAQGGRRGASGRIRATTTTAREFQLGVKFVF